MIIFALSTFLTGLAYGSDIPQIKQRYIKCLHKTLENKTNISKEKYLYLVFSNDRNSALMLSPLTKDSVYVYTREWKVKTYLTEINLQSKNSNSSELWYLDRKTGKLTQYPFISDAKAVYYGMCETVERGFDPVEYMNNFVKKNIEKTEKELKF